VGRPIAGSDLAADGLTRDAEVPQGGTGEDAVVRRRMLSRDVPESASWRLVCHPAQRAERRAGSVEVRHTPVDDGSGSATLWTASPWATESVGA
jgi:hypothetical protein